MTEFFQIRSVSPSDWADVHTVLEKAFASPLEARLVNLLREDRLVHCEFLAATDGKIVGSIVFSPLQRDGENQSISAVALAPLAVLPAYQRQGAGKALVRAGLQCCRKSGIEVVVVLGDPAYYQQFGFDPTLAERIDSPYAGPALMALELVKGSMLSGPTRMDYPAAFSIVD